MAVALEIRIDRRACQGARACMRRAPGTFWLDDEGKSAAHQAPDDDPATVREAAAACPFFAITVRKAGD